MTIFEGSDSKKSVSPGKEKGLKKYFENSRRFLKISKVLEDLKRFMKVLKGISESARGSQKVLEGSRGSKRGTSQFFIVKNMFLK